MTQAPPDPDRPDEAPRPAVPPTGPVRAADADADAEGVRRQRRHIQALTGEDPLRGGVAD